MAPGRTPHHGTARRAPGRVRCPSPSSEGGVLIALRVLHRGARLVRAWQLQPNRGRAGSVTVSDDSGPTAAGLAEPDDSALLAPHLTEETHRELLDAAAGRSKREVEELLARRFPRPDVPSSVRKVPERRPMVASDSSPVTRLEPPPTLDPAQPVRPPAPPTAPPATASRPSRVTPLSTDRYEVRFTARAETRAKLKLAQDLLRHAVPSGDPAEIFDRALTALIDALSRKKLAIVRKPARARRSSTAASRHVPAGSSGRYGNGTEARARSSARADVAATNLGGSSSTT